MPGFVPAVWYSKEDKDSESEEEKKNSLERARILKGDHIVSGEEVYKDGPDGKLIAVEHNFDLDDLGVALHDNGELHLRATDADADVILSSCGILATSSSQVLSSLLKDRHRASSEESLVFKRRSGGVEECMGSSSSEQVRMLKGAGGGGEEGAKKEAGQQPTQARSNAADLIQKRRKRHHSSADLYEKKRSGATVPPIEEMMHDMTKEDVKKMHSSTAPGVRPDAGPHHVNLAHSNGGPSSSTTSATSEPTTKLFSLPPVLKEENCVLNGSSESLTAPQVESNQVMDTMSGTVSGEAPDGGSALQGGTGPEEEGERPRHPKIQMIHPSMKLSFSDTSLSTTFHEMEHLDVDLKQSEATGLTSPFSKLRVKMSNLAIPNIVSGQSKRSQAQNLAMENKYLSELRFKECKTRIILL